MCSCVHHHLQLLYQLQYDCKSRFIYITYIVKITPSKSLSLYYRLRLVGQSYIQFITVYGVQTLHERIGTTTTTTTTKAERSRRSTSTTYTTMTLQHRSSNTNTNTNHQNQRLYVTHSIITISLAASMLFCNVFFAIYFRMMARNVLLSSSSPLSSSSSSSSMILKSEESSSPTTTTSVGSSSSSSSSNYWQQIQQQQQQHPEGSVAVDSSHVEDYLPSSLSSSSSPSSLVKCKTNVSIKKIWYKSQRNEDEHLYTTFFPNMCNGTYYLELGGLDGIRKSNTYFIQQRITLERYID